MCTPSRKPWSPSTTLPWLPLSPPPWTTSTRRRAHTPSPSTVLTSSRAVSLAKRRSRRSSASLWSLWPAASLLASALSPPHFLVSSTWMFITDKDIPEPSSSVGEDSEAHDVFSDVTANDGDSDDYYSDSDDDITVVGEDSDDDDALTVVDDDDDAVSTELAAFASRQAIRHWIQEIKIGSERRWQIPRPPGWPLEDRDLGTSQKSERFTTLAGDLQARCHRHPYRLPPPPYWLSPSPSPHLRVSRRHSCWLLSPSPQHRRLSPSPVALVLAPGSPILLFLSESAPYLSSPPQSPSLTVASSRPVPPSALVLAPVTVASARQSLPRRHGTGSCTVASVPPPSAMVLAPGGHFNLEVGKQSFPTVTSVLAAGADPWRLSGTPGNAQPALQSTSAPIAGVAPRIAALVPPCSSSGTGGDPSFPLPR
ncbi:hypothetical protein B0H14DRAFT_3165192 [Mycena olivaceomarginata]|nr:hypothetical protein B0H14DRAFT_3165192 [Mycena olivaceomarginata]